VSEEIVQASKISVEEAEKVDEKRKLMLECIKFEKIDPDEVIVK